MKPTSKTLCLAPQIQNILREVSLLESEQLPFTPETSKRDFKFAGPDAAVVLILSPIMRYMQQHAPDVRLTAVQLDMENLYTKLESGKIDLAEGIFPHLVPGIKRQRIFGFGYMSLVGKDHPRIDAFTHLNAFLAEQHALVAATRPETHRQ